jgi:hypothetical protein
MFENICISGNFSDNHAKTLPSLFIKSGSNRVLEVYSIDKNPVNQIFPLEGTNRGILLQRKLTSQQETEYSYVSYVQASANGFEDKGSYVFN